METTTGLLETGFIDENGVAHREFAMRLPTLEDMERAIEQAGPGACGARVKRHIWAATLLRLGALPQARITPELLASLPDTEYNVFLQAENALRERARSASADCGTSV